MIVEAILGINLALAVENTDLPEKLTQPNDKEKRQIYLETLTKEELDHIDAIVERLNQPSRPDPYWCLSDPELFAVMVDTCGPEPRQTKPK